MQKIQCLGVLVPKTPTKTKLIAPFLTLMLGVSVSCAHKEESAELKISFPTEADRDPKYSEIYEQNTRRESGIKNFETRFKVAATQLGSQFRSALAERYQYVYNEPQPLLSEASNQAGYFVTIYVADENSGDLGNPQIWNIQLKQPSGVLKPSLVKKLRPKEMWRAFFPDISAWSQEYLILFDSPAASQPSDHKLVNQPDNTLILSGPEGQIQFHW